MLKPSELNCTDINEFHFALAWGCEAAMGVTRSPTETQLAKFTPRELFHFEEGKRRARAELATA